MGKKALLVGCNYPGTKAELKGCVNDVRRMHRCLLDRFGFAEEDIVVLIDTDSSYVQPTGANIKRAVSRLVRSAEPGDSLFFHYSGHGTRLPAGRGEDDDTGYDECIVPCDMNLITDEDFRNFVNKIPEGCRITIVSDSCHSGGLLQNSKEQIGDSTRQDDDSPTSGGLKAFLKQSIHNAFRDTFDSRGINHLNGTHHPPAGHQTKNRSLPLSTLIDIVKQKTGKEDVDAGKLRPAIFDLFGEDASPKIKKFMHAIGSGGLMGKVGRLAHELKHKLDVGDDNDNEYRVKETDSREDDDVAADKGILVSGCQTDETSADANPVGGGEDGAYGALSNAIQSILAERDGRISNRELVKRARKVLSWQGFKQHPGLYCSDDNADDPFIC